MYEQQYKTISELAQLRTHSANDTAKTTELVPVATEGEQSAKRAKVVRGSGSGVSAPSTAAYSALLAERDKLRSRCETVILGNQCMPCLAEEAKQLRAKVADTEKLNALAGGLPDKEKRKTGYRHREACECARGGVESSSGRSEAKYWGCRRV